MKPLLASALLATSLASFAGTTAPLVESPAPPVVRTESSDWSWRVALYGWAQSLDGDVTVRGFSAPVDLKFSDLLEDLDMAFMGLVEVKRGRWGLLADVNYADMGDSIGLPFGRSVEFGLQQWLVNGYLTYDLVRDGATNLDVFAGARFNSMELELGTRSKRESWGDPAIGLRFQQNLSESFFFRAVGDVGGFGVSSDFTWQSMAGFGWRFSGNGNALIGYRAIGTDYADGDFEYDVTAHGPVIGVEFSF
jgi:hypothetical protein